MPIENTGLVGLFNCCYCGRSSQGEAWVRPSHPRQLWCGTCVQRQFSPCTRCGVRQDNLVTLRHTLDMDPNAPRRQICLDCYRPMRGDRFEGTNKNFPDASSFGSSRYFGVELETNLGKAPSTFAFNAKGDGTISGWEFVSHKLRGDAGIEELRAFMESAEHIEYHDNCGYHLHMDMGDLNNEQCRSVFAAYTVTENFWFGKVKQSRQTNNYCYHLQEHIFSDIQCTTNYYDFAEMQDRYAWVNASSYCRHRTLENRLHHATWDFDEVSDWAILNLRFFEAVKDLEFRRTDTFEGYKQRVSLALEWAQSKDSIEALTLTGSREPSIVMGEF